MNGPCLCGDPYCGSCFPGRDHRGVKCSCGWAGEGWELETNDSSHLTMPGVSVGECPECSRNVREEKGALIVEDFCDACKQHKPCSCDDMADERPRKLTRNERLQIAADRGYDTWEDYNGEK